jgi:hypothetical protein
MFQFLQSIFKPKCDYTKRFFCSSIFIQKASVFWTNSHFCSSLIFADIARGTPPHPTVTHIPLLTYFHSFACTYQTSLKVVLAVSTLAFHPKVPIAKYKLSRLSRKYNRYLNMSKSSGKAFNLSHQLFSC